MKKLITAAAVTVTLLAAGCSSDSTPAPQATTTQATVPAQAAVDGGLVAAAGFATAGTWTHGDTAIAVTDLSLDNGNRVYSRTISASEVDSNAPWNVNLQQVLTSAITQGKIYTLTFKAKSDVTRSINVGIGQNAAPWHNDKKPADLTPTWQDFQVSLAAANFDGTGNRIFFELAGQEGAVMLDNVKLVEATAAPVTKTQIDLPVNFQGSTVDYTLTDFGNASSEVVADSTDATNMVVKTIKPNNAESWAGTTIGNDSNAVASQGFATNIPFTATATTISVDVYSPDVGTPILFKVERTDDGDKKAETKKLTTVANQWETIVFDLSDVDTGTNAFDHTLNYNKASIFFNFGVTGALAGEKVYFWDNVKFGGAAASTFDDGLLTNGDFESGNANWLAGVTNATDASNIIDDGGNKIYSVDVTAAGAGHTVNLSQKLAITDGKTYKLNFRAKSNVARSMIAGIGLSGPPWTNVTDNTVALTTGWNDFEYSFTANFSATDARVLFDMGEVVSQVQIDNVSLVEVAAPSTFDDGLLTNGGFESGNANWLDGITNATDASNIIDDGGNKIYSVNIDTAGAAHAVNLSQKLAITDGKTYKLNFKAKSNVARTMIAGIGLSGAPWSSVTDNAVALTTGWNDFEYSFTANFSATDARVLFDMGEVVSQVQIDNVSLVEVVSSGATALPTLDFESPTTGAGLMWAVFENNDDPALEIVANPSATGVNTSAMVAKITARASSSGAKPYAGTVTEDLPTYTLDATNKVVKVMVYKSVISDVGVKFESLQANGGKASTGEIKVANTLTNQWEELTFDFTSVIGNPVNTDITGFVFFPDFIDPRAAESVTYFDNISFGQ